MSEYNALLQKYTKLGEQDKIQVLLDSRKENITVKQLAGLLKNTSSLTASEISVYQDMLEDISARRAADIFNIRAKFSSVQGTSSEQTTTAKSTSSGHSVLTEHEIFFNFGGGFIIHDLLKFSYDNNLNMIEDWYQFYDSTAGWINAVKNLYSYDGLNRDTQRVNQGWDTLSLSWVDYVKSSNTYSANNNLLNTIYSQWTDPEWVLWGRDLYTYDASNNTLERLFQILVNSEWVNDSRSTYTYDVNNNLLTDMYETWDGTAWQEFIKMEDTYDANNNVVSHTFSIFGNYSSKDIYTYDSNNNQITDSNYSWNSNSSSWDIYFVQTSTFDAMNNLNHYLIKLSNGSALVDYLKYDATFNSFNNITTWRSYTLDAGNWVPRRKAEYSYDSDQNVTLITDSSSSNGGLTWKLFGRQSLTWGTDVTGVEDDNSLPSAFQLSQNYPNPFNPITRINYQIPQDGKVNLKIYDILGNELKTLLDEYKAAGRYAIEFSGGNLPSGVYLYRLQAGSFVETKKMILMK